MSRQRKQTREESGLNNRMILFSSQALLKKKKTKKRKHEKVVKRFFALKQSGVEKGEAKGGGRHRGWGFHPQLRTGCYTAELH